MLLNKFVRACIYARRTPFDINKTKFSLTSYKQHKAAYDGEGKTTVKIINQDQDAGLMIDSYGTFGFRLNNGITVLGPMAIFPRTVLSWQVDRTCDITPESLVMFRLLEPKVDLLVIGVETSDRRQIDTLFRATREAKLNVEIVPTEHACSTFNFLNAEGRSVAGALIPPLHVTVNEDDMLSSQLHYNNLYTKRNF